MKSFYFSLILLLFISCAPAKEVWVHRLPNFSAEPIELNKDSKKCQICGHKIVPILYGLPSDIGLKKAKNGKLRFRQANRLAISPLLIHLLPKMAVHTLTT